MKSAARFGRYHVSRRAIRAIALGISGMLLAAGVFLLQTGELAYRLSMATAYAALVLLSTSMVIGPINVLRGRPNPVSTHLRRDVGVLSALFALLHTLFGLQVHFGGRIWSYFMDPVTGVLREDAFGVANYTGLGALLILIGLLALSNNLSLRKLGTSKWKRLQRWSYVAALLTFGHGALYQLIEKRDGYFVMSFGLCAALVAGLQVAGFRRRRAGTWTGRGHSRGTRETAEVTEAN